MVSSITFPIVLTGMVEHGTKIGSSINVPTANIVPREKIDGIKFGVYYSAIVIDGVSFKGITNIGCKPTVNDKGNVNVETYIFDFEGDLYDREVEVDLLEFRRPEKKFDSIDELSKTIHADMEAGRKYTGSTSIDKKN